MKNGAGVHEDKEWKKRAMNSINIMNEAPVSILIFNEYGDNPSNELSIDQRFQELVDIQSIGAAIQNMALTATELGIGTLWICYVFIAYEDICTWSGQSNQLIAALTMGILPIKVENAIIFLCFLCAEILVWFSGLLSGSA